MSIRTAIFLHNPENSELPNKAKKQASEVDDND